MTSLTRPSSQQVPTPAEPMAWLLDRVVPLTWEVVLIGTILALTLVSRLWGLGERVMSHDESLHVYYAWQLATGKGYAHSPMMHGPFLFEATALMNFLFGAGDFTSRLVPALLGGLIVVVIPQLLKPWLGWLGALVTSVLLLVSPYVLYYSRYIRHDIQVIAWLLLLVVAVFRYLQQRRDRDLLLAAAALALMLATMEISFIYLAIVAGFLGLRAVIIHRAAWSSLRRSAEFDLLVVLATLGAFFSAPIALLLLNPLWVGLTGAPFVDPLVLSSLGAEWMTGPAAPRLWGLLAGFGLAAVTIGLWWDRRRWPKLAGLFGVIIVVLYSTFFTNPAGLGTGLIGSLGYWLAQQEIARGSQPWYYYLLVFPLYEYLPLLGGLLAAGYYLLRRRSLPVLSLAFVPFGLWWAGLIFVSLSVAGEKMPWLSVHIAIPFILLTGWLTGQLLIQIRTNRGLRLLGPGVALFTLALLFGLTLRTSYLVTYVNYDYTTEPIGYAHGAPGVKWAMQDIERIAAQQGAGHGLKVAYDDETSWPMVWYLRDFTNQAFYAADPNRQALDAPVVLAVSQNWAKVEGFLGNRYARYEVIFRWWPLEDYRDLTWDRVRSTLADPAKRAALWDIIWNRDYSRYAELTGQTLLPPARWPFASQMRVYIRQDIAAQLPDLSLNRARLADLPPEVDAYAGLERLVTPVQVAAAGGLNAPRGLAVGPDGSLYVADTANSRIVKFDDQGNLLATWGGRTIEGQNPPAAGTFTDPWSLAVDSQGSVYVADTWNHRVQKFDSNGRFLLEWGVPGLVAEGPGQFWGPRGIAIGPEGQVYVTDTGNRRVVVFNPDGRLLFEFQSEGEAQLDEPVGIAMGPDNQVYVADTWNRRVAVFSAAGEFLRSWPVQAWAGESLDNKPYLAVDSQGQVYVTDPEGYRVIVFSNDGQPLATFGQYGPEPEAFGLPAGVVVAPDGSIWVSDAGNNRLAHFEAWQPSGSGDDE